MKPCYLAFHTDWDPSTRTWCATGQDRRGRIFGVGSGATAVEAATALRESVLDSLGADAADGVDGTLALALRPPRRDHLVFTASDLLPLRLRRLRANRRLRQADLALRLGISQQAYAKLERPGANPTLQTLLLLEEVLDGELLALA